MRVLDLFCCAGGAAMGLHRAWPDAQIVGVDIRPQPRYPFTFVQADAMSYPLDGFDFIWASPPCQAYSWSAKRWKHIERADLLPATRERLIASGIPFCMENVVGAPMLNYIMLCGTMFGLGVIRHRQFETSSTFHSLIPPCAHNGSVRGGHYVTVAGHGGDNAKGCGSRAAKQRAMGIDWMNDEELNQSIPPAYSEFIARQMAL